MRRLVAVTRNRHERRASKRFRAMVRQLLQFLPNSLRVAARDRTGAHRQSRQIDGDKTEASETDAHVGKVATKFHTKNSSVFNF